MPSSDDRHVREIFQPAAQQVITSTSFVTYGMAQKYRLLQERTGLDFGASVRLLEHLPVFLDGERHKALRRRLAMTIAATRAAQEAGVARALRQLMESGFARPGRVELVDGFARPLWRAIAGGILGEDDELLDLADDVPQLFMTTLSIRRRRDIDARIERLAGARGWADEDFARLAPVALGARPFVGSMALSIYDAVSRRPRSRAHEFEWPDTFGLSSLRFVDRVCRSPTRVDGQGVAEGERLRCVTQHADYGRERNAEALYGFGAHLCLGRSISQYAWNSVGAALRDSRRVLWPVELRMARRADPFHMPETATIGVAP